MADDKTTKTPEQPERIAAGQGNASRSPKRAGEGFRFPGSRKKRRNRR